MRVTIIVNIIRLYSFENINFIFITQLMSNKTFVFLSSDDLATSD